jgi:hypothetical protein
MKKVFITLVTIIFCYALHGQESQIKDNTIVISTKDSFDIAFKNIGRLLVSNGYSIDDANKDFGTITTNEILMGNKLDPVWEMKVTAMITGTENVTIVLTAMTKGPGSSWEKLEKRSNMHMMSRGWTKLEDLAKKYEGTIITYEKR